jgi:serine/threonine protein kinase
MVGAYQILGLIGQGGGGQVFKAQHTVTKRVEAIKALSAKGHESSEQAQRFQREVQIHASLSHPNIASVHNAFWAGDDLVLVMEFVEGESLKRVLEHRRIPVRVAIHYICQALSALEYAHENKVTHRDVTPGNILVTASGQVKLTDFGVAKLKTDRGLTKSGTMVGTLYYMSPEQVRAVSEIDPRMDIYSIGAVLYEAVTGSKPFLGDSAFSIMMAHVSEEPQAPNALEPALPAGLSQIILKALAKKPEDRFQSAEELRLALEPFQDCENESGNAYVVPSASGSALMILPAQNSSSQQFGKEWRRIARIDNAGSKETRFRRLMEAAGRQLLSAFRAPAMARSAQWGSDLSATWQSLKTAHVTPRVRSLRWLAVSASVVAGAGLVVVAGSRPLSRQTPSPVVKSELHVPVQIVPEPAPMTAVPLLETAQKMDTGSDKAQLITIGLQSQPRQNRATRSSWEYKKIAAKAPAFIPEYKTVSLVTNDESLMLSPAEELDLLNAPAPPYSIVKTTSDLGDAWKQDPDGWWNFSGPDKFAMLNPVREGTVSFQVQRKKSGPIKFLGKEKSSWVAFFIDAKNHLLFELEPGQLIISEILRGTKQLKRRVPVEKDSSQVTIQLSASLARLSIGNMASLETAPDKSLIGGKFGFKGHASIKDFQLVTP